LAEKNSSNEEAAEGQSIAEALSRLASPDPWVRIETVGRLAVGRTFMTELAKPLGVRRQTLYNWLHKPETIPKDIDVKLLLGVDGIEKEFLKEVRRRAKVLARLKEELARNINKANTGNAPKK